MKKDYYKTPESTLTPVISSAFSELTLTLVTEQLSEVLAQAEALVIDAISHILAAHAASEAVPYDQPACLTKTCHHIGLNNQPRKITITGTRNNLSLMEKNLAYLTTRISSYKPKDRPSSIETAKAKCLLSEEIGRLALTSLKGHKQLKKLVVVLKDEELSVEEIAFSEDARQYFKEIEASTHRLAFISGSIASSVDCMLCITIDHRKTATEDDRQKNLPIDV